MTPPFEIRSFEDRDLEQVVGLWQATFGTWPESDFECDDPKRFFAWKHMTNPFGRSALMVAVADGTVIGTNCYLRWHFRTNGGRLLALRGTDVAVHPDYQRHGVYKTFVREARNYRPREAALLLSDPNPGSRPETIKTGMRPIGRLPLFVRARAPIRGGIRRLGNQVRHNSRAFPIVEAEPAWQALRDAKAISELLRAADDPAALLTTDRSVDYLRWKYGTWPGYSAVREYREGVLVGLGIFRVAWRRSMWASVLCELLVGRGDRRAARRLLRRVSSAATTDCVLAHFHHGSTARRALRQVGFLPTRSGHQPVVRVMQTDILPEPTLNESWALCLGDFDLV